MIDTKKPGSLALSFVAGALCSAALISTLPSSLGYWGMIPVALGGSFTLLRELVGYGDSLNSFAVAVLVFPVVLLLLGWVKRWLWLTLTAGCLWSFIGFLGGYAIWI